MLPPKYTKTVTVVANGGSAKVTAKYSGSQGEEEVTVDLNQDQTHTFPEKSEDMGTWTAVKKITHIHGNVAGNPFTQSIEEHCDGVQGNVHYSLHPQEGVKLLAKN